MHKRSPSLPAAPQPLSPRGGGIAAQVPGFIRNGLARWQYLWPSPPRFTGKRTGVGAVLIIAFVGALPAVMSPSVVIAKLSEASSRSIQAHCRLARAAKRSRREDLIRRRSPYINRARGGITSTPELKHKRHPMRSPRRHRRTARRSRRIAAQEMDESASTFGAVASIPDCRGSTEPRPVGRWRAASTTWLRDGCAPIPTAARLLPARLHTLPRPAADELRAHRDQAPAPGRDKHRPNRRGGS